MNSKKESIKCTIPFDSERKKSLVAIQRPENPQMVRIFVKGAPEFMLEVCTKYMTGEHSTADIDQEKKNHIINDIIKLNFAP